MKYQVILTPGAFVDLSEIYEYIAAEDSVSAAEHVLTRISDAVNNLSELPNRGTRLRELHSHFPGFREVFFKPYRIIYEVLEVTRQVRVHIICDGRRDMKQLLQRRLLPNPDTLQ